MRCERAELAALVLLRSCWTVSFRNEFTAIRSDAGRLRSEVSEPMAIFAKVDDESRGEHGTVSGLCPR